MISVIVPVYNVAGYIDKCIESVISQTVDDWELVLINDGSKDNSLEICEQYAQKDARIKVFDKQNGGVSSARNMGIEKSTGDYILFLDGDDYLESTLLEDFVNNNSNNDLDLFMFEYSVDYDDKTVIHKSDAHWYGENDTEKALINTITTNNRLIGVKIYKKSIIGDIRFDESIILGEDTMFAVEVVSNAKTCFFSDKLYYHYYQSANSAVRSSFTTKKLTGLVAYENDIKLCANKGYKKAELYAKDAYVVLAIALAQKAIADNDYDEKPALKTIKQGIRKYGKAVLKSPVSSKKVKLKTLVACVSIRLVSMLCKMLGDK